MKKLVLIATLITSISSIAACDLTFQVKKDGAKTAYINGVSVSAKIRDALSTQCTLKTTVMSKEEIKQMSIDSLEKRLAKLRTK